MLYFLQFLLPSWSISLEKNIFNLNECFYLDKQRIYESLFAKKWLQLLPCDQKLFIVAQIDLISFTNDMFDKL